MFERFTERARQVVVLAQDEARGLKHNYIGTEHLLLGLLREEQGLAARVLESFGVTVEEVRFQVARIVGQGDQLTMGRIPFTPRTKKILELSLRESLSLGNNYIGTEHLLLGLARENEGVAARILVDFGVDAEKIRNEIVRMLSGPSRRLGAVPDPELEAVRQEKEEAIESGEFERAAMLRDRERQMASGWREGSLELDTSYATITLGGESRRDRLLFWLLSWGPLGLALAVGVFIGWLIWG